MSVTTLLHLHDDIAFSLVMCNLIFITKTTEDINFDFSSDFILN